MKSYNPHLDPCTAWLGNSSRQCFLPQASCQQPLLPVQPHYSRTPSLHTHQHTTNTFRLSLSQYLSFFLSLFLSRKISCYSIISVLVIDKIRIYIRLYIVIIFCIISYHFLSSFLPSSGLLFPPAWKLKT